MKRLNKLIGLFLLFSCLQTVAIAQQVKHPRVVEVEKSLTTEALNILKSRFPDQPFLVSVSIDPLHREKANKGDKAQSLPYYLMDEEEIVDEWDDVQVPQVVLMNRIKRINVILSLPSTLNDDEIAEIKTSMTESLGLFSARDNIDVRKRSFGKGKSAEEIAQKKEDFFGYVILSALGWALLMIGLFMIAWFTTSRLSKAAKDIKISGGSVGSENAATGAVAMSGSAPGGSGYSSGSGSGKQSISGDLKFNDPLKTREVILNSLKRLEEKEVFPSFEDMILMNDFCQKDPETYGALLSEFPSELKNYVFAHSKGDFWLQAVDKPGEINSSAIEFLNSLIRQPRAQYNKKMEELLICIWRLDEKMVEFFKSQNQNQVFTLLNKLPSSISIPIARECFPGAWAALINKSFTPVEFSENQISELVQKAVKLTPLRQQSEVQKYQENKEMLKFLRTVDPVTEKEIYNVSSNQLLETMRPPFFKVFEVEDSVLEKLFPMMTIEEWALSFLNVARPERRRLESFMSDKQKFKYFFYLKQFDQNPPDKDYVGSAREKGGRLMSELMKSIELEKSLSQRKSEQDQDMMSSSEKVA